MPYGSVTTDELLVVGRELDKLVGLSEVERAFVGLGGVPFHAATLLVLARFVTCVASADVPVLWGNLTEVRLDDGGVGTSVQAAGVGAGTKVLPALCNHSIRNTLRSLAFIEDGLWLCHREGRNQSTGGEKRDEGEFHDCRSMVEVEIEVEVSCDRECHLRPCPLPLILPSVWGTGILPPATISFLRIAVHLSTEFA